MPRWLIVVSIALLAGLAAAAFCYREATQAPRVAVYRMDDPRWPAARRPLRIVLLSDIHVAGPDMPVARLRRIVAQANALKPDLVALTGDYVSDKRLRTATVTSAAAVAPFAGLRASLGVYAVLGNHDHERGAPAMAVALKRAGATLLSNRSEAAGPVIVAGVDDLVTGHADLPAALAGVGGARPVILLSHSPDLFPEVDARVAVTLAGHTHAGQIAPPLIGPIFTASRYGRRYAQGHVVERGRHLVVSAGLGTSILPLRLGAPPEIVLVELH